MKFAIIVSEKDLAGMNIKERLLDKFDFVKTNEIFHNDHVYNYEIDGKQISIYTLKLDTVFFETIDQEIKTDFFIFATRHQSESGEKTLSVHVPGNYDKAKFGGTEKELCMASASLMKDSFKILNELGKKTEFSITLEATHHGPLIKTPVMFIEIGSREEQWQDKNAAGIIAKTIIKTIETYEKIDYETAIGFGGTHYCSGFNKLEVESNIAMSHICPKYAIDFIDKDMVQKMINSTSEKVDFALLDWKGMNVEQRDKVKLILEEMKIRWRKTKGI